MKPKFRAKSKAFGVFVLILLGGIYFFDIWVQENVLANGVNINELNKEIEQLEQQQKQQMEEQKNIDVQVDQLAQQKQKTQEEIRDFDIQMNATAEQINKKETGVKETKLKVQLVEEEIGEAEKEIEARDELLKTRIRHMYEMGGSISYLEVLLGASSFGEFIERVEFLSLITQQDKKILEDYIRNKERIEQKKLEVEQLIVQLEQQLMELQTLQRRIDQQRKERSVRIAAITEEQAELLELDEQIQQEVLNLVNDVAAKRSQVKKQQEERERLRRERERQQQTTNNQQEYAGKFVWPVPASTRITSPFGLRVHPITGKQNGHNGLDIGARVPGTSGDDIVATEDGVVIIAEYLRGYGNTVVIDHGNNIRTLYAHIRNGGIKVKVGDSVSKGQKIAEVGSTGNSTGPHLHFEVHENGKQVDPMPYLK